MNKKIGKTVIVLFVFCVTFFRLVESLRSEDNEAGNEQEKIEMLIQAMCQAQVPSDSMKIELLYESDNSGRIFPLEASTHKQPPSYPVRTTKEYTILIKGIRSRIEYLQKSINTKEPQQPYDIRKNISVFDGAKQLVLVERIKGALTIPKGSQHLYDRNRSQLVRILYGWPFDLADTKEREKYRFRLLESGKNGFYILEAKSENGCRYCFTLDEEKDFHLVKVERFRADNTKDYETNFFLMQYDEGVWYTSERQRVRYPVSGKNGPAYVEYRIEVKNLRFNPPTGEKDFNLIFPAGTRLWDNILGSWFVVGAPEQALIDFSDQKEAD